MYSILWHHSFISLKGFSVLFRKRFKNWTEVFSFVMVLLKSQNWDTNVLLVTRVDKFLPHMLISLGFKLLLIVLGSLNSKHIFIKYILAL